MTVAELKEILEKFADDVEVCVDIESEHDSHEFFEVTDWYDDEARAGCRGVFLKLGEELPSL